MGVWQKQSSIGVLTKRWSENMQQIYRRKPMPNCDFNKVAPWRSYVYAFLVKKNLYSAANKDWSTVKENKFMITVTVGFSKKSFLLWLFPRNSFINDLELVFLELNTLQNAQTEQIVSFYQKVFFLSVHFLLAVSWYFILFDCV